jgi:hypothetical protein
MLLSLMIDSKKPPAGAPHGRLSSLHGILYAVMRATASSVVHKALAM